VREALKAQEGIRGTFSGTVDRFGTKSAFRGPPLPTVMLREVKDASGKIVADHLWMTVGKQINALLLQTGDEAIVAIERMSTMSRSRQTIV
jgi:hypothetical protein